MNARALRRAGQSRLAFASFLLYRIVVDTGNFEIIKTSDGSLTTDRRHQALFIAFSYGAFIQVAGSAASA